MPTEARHHLLDDAWARQLAGRSEEALQIAAAALAADPSQLGAAFLVLEALTGLGRTGHQPAAASRLLDAALRRGELPRALAVAAWLASKGLDAEPARARIAAAFGQGSPRLAEVPHVPPPLPPHVAPAQARGPALLDLAERALRAFVDAEDPFPEDAPIARAPLFSALPPAALERLLAAWKLSTVAAGTAVIEEGTEGRHAYLVVRGRLRAQRGGAQRGAGEAPTVLAELGPGALFGEMALVSAAPRAASVLALDPVQLLVASRDALEELARETPQIGAELSLFCRARMISNLVRHSPILRAVAPRDREALVDRFEARTFAPGEALVRQGREVQGLFLIASGAVQVSSEDADGEVLQVALLGPGDVVGEIGLVLRRPAMATVVATHPTLALELRRERFGAVIKEYPGLLAELYELATKREEETRTVVAQEALDVEGIVLV